MKTEDSYYYWIENVAEQKFRDTDKYRYSEMIAFTKWHSEKQNKALRVAIEESEHIDDARMDLYELLK